MEDEITLDDDEISLTETTSFVWEDEKAALFLKEKTRKKNSQATFWGKKTQNSPPKMLRTGQVPEVGIKTITPTA
ncbi:MAG: hypothetical protein CM1200mP4_2040 [Rhodospirillaceae bacterium]|nr:MAG: hypothetical protein CM1200mP4_2040 [Rhodospirillaceae bacterium]